MLSIVGGVRSCSQVAQSASIRSPLLFHEGGVVWDRSRLVLSNEGGALEAAYFWSHEHPSAYHEISSTRHETVTPHDSRFPTPQGEKKSEGGIPIH